ncbi:MAG: hypothetical protein RRB13_03785 [bacterium]|nr:hypothetical protein [bacterium]
MKHLIKTSLICALGLASLASCRSDNKFKEGMANSELLLPYAKYLKINRSYSTRVGGAINPQVSSSQAFDSGYWGWENQEASLSGTTALTYRATWDQPLPTNSYESYYLINFADGTWPRNYVHTGVLRPKEITGYTYEDYDSSGNVTTSSTPDTYNVAYDSQTGLISAASYKTYTTAGVLDLTYIYSFTTDPRSYSDYYQSTYAVYSGTSLTSLGSQATTISVVTSGNNEVETTTQRNYNSSGTLADFSYSSFGTKNGSTAVKYVHQLGTYTDATTDISSDSVVATETWYSDETTAIYKKVVQSYYEDITTRVPISVTSSEYTVSGGTETLAAKTVDLYTDGFLTTQKVYTVSSGVAILNTSTVTTRNSRGRPTSVEVQNSSGTATYRTDYTYDSSYRLETVRNYSISSGADSCAAGSYDMSYTQYTSAAGATLYGVTKTTYDCSGTTLSTDPSGRTVTTYDTNFDKTSVEVATYASGTFTLTSKLGYTYNSSHQITQLQTYDLTIPAFPTEAGFTSYLYDSNGFLTSTITQNSDGTTNASYRIYSYTYR